MRNYVTLSPLGSSESPNHIRGAITDETGNYLLEVGNHCMADPDTLAFGAMAPEIHDFLSKCNTPMASLLLDTIEQLSRQIHLQQLHGDRKDTAVAS